jgi:hypothetical protein
MTSNDLHQDPVLAAMGELRTYDVSPALADRLRTRCHRELASRDASNRAAAGVWTRVAATLACAWSVVYLFETIRRAAVVFGF